MTKICTSIEQSKKLSSLGFDISTADMFYNLGESKIPEVIYGSHDDFKCYIPCWSLAALLSVLPKKYYPVKDHETNLILGKPKDKWCVLYWDATGIQDGEETIADNPVDACYKMIIKLHEQNLL